jgi:hypothetical protein
VLQQQAHALVEISRSRSAHGSMVKEADLDHGLLVRP